MIRLDHHTGPPVVCAPALERMRAALEGKTFSLEASYKTLYELAGAGPSSTFVFTASGAEAINQVHWTAFLEKARREGKCHFVTSSAEEAPLLQSLKRLEDLGCFVKIIPLLPNGEIDLAALREAIGPRTALLSFSTAQALTGVLQPIEEIAALAQEKGVLLHVDATYSLGKIPSSFDALSIDYLTFGGERLHAPANTGGLLVKAKRPLVPFVLGGPEQAGLRGGPFDLPSFHALAAAASQALLSLDLMHLEVARLRDHLEAKLLARLPKASVVFAEHRRLPNTTVLSFPHVHQEMLLYALQRKQIAASLGGTYAPHLYRQLMACGVDEETALSAVSFGLSRFHTQEEIERAAAWIAETVEALQPLAQELFA